MWITMFNPEVPYIINVLKINIFTEIMHAGSLWAQCLNICYVNLIVSVCTRVTVNGPFARSGHMVQNHTCW